MVRIVLLSLFLLVYAGCSTVQVKTSYKPTTDFSRLKTYSWLHDVDQPGENVRINNDLVKTAVRSGVEETLKSKGYTRTEPEQADFLITWFGAIEKKVRQENIDHFYAPYGYGALYRDPYWNSQAGPSPGPVREFEQGTLALDFLDPASKTLIWRGVGSDQVIKGRPEEEVRRNVKAAVAAILADFPPN